MSNPSLTLSVALCTYNGAKFLPEQLASIAGQTRLPDEVVIRDDRSQDQTIAIVEQWAATVPFPVQTAVNQGNLGSTRNFAGAIAAVTGDLVVLSDQDDVWVPHKLARLADFFARHPDKEAVFTDGWLVDDSLRHLQRLSAKVGFRGPVVQRDLASGRIVATLTQRALATGATMALRAGLREALLPLPERLPRDLIHDGWIATVAALRGTLGFIDEPLILYRQHAGQQLGLSPVKRAPDQPRWQSGSARERILAANADDAALLLDILRARFPQLAGKFRSFEERARHQVTRRDLPIARVRRVVPVLRELFGGRYHRYAQGVKTALADLAN